MEELTAKPAISAGVVRFRNLHDAVTYRGDLTVVFDGNANFCHSNITGLGQLQSIGGYANFSNSNVTDLGQLQSIGGDAFFSGSPITDKKRCEKITKGMCFL